MISIEPLINHSLGNYLCHNASRMMTQGFRHHTKVVSEHTKKYSFCTLISNYFVLYSLKN